MSMHLTLWTSNAIAKSLRGQFCGWLALVLCLSGCNESGPSEFPDANGIYHVYPGDSIQKAIDAAAASDGAKRVIVHAGIYRPMVEAQALIYFNARHDGVIVEALGDVILTAANPQLADRSSASYPAVVNHVVYFGDGISRSTVLRDFKITGANNFITRSDHPVCIEKLATHSPLRKRLFFYSDGGGIKIFGRSYPTIEGIELYNNYASPCAGGVSIENQGLNAQSPLLKDCIFRNNRSQVTGSAVDVLPGSAAELENCLFIDNIANTGEDFVGQQSGNEHNKLHGSGALTVFRRSRARVVRCTFTGNWNGVDDKGIANVYKNCIFWQNTATGGISAGDRYEIDILDGSGVSGCWIEGKIIDLRKTINPVNNVLNAPDPEFDQAYEPLAKEYAGVGYRPQKQKKK